MGLNTQKITTFITCREGNKYKYANNIVNLFCKHEVYIELFSGFGSVFFTKNNNAKMNILNDSSNFIYELLTTLQNKESFENLINEIKDTVIYWDIIKNNNSLVSKLLRIANSFKGCESSLRLDKTNYKDILLNNLLEIKNEVLDKLNKNTKILKKDAFEFIKSLDSSLKNKKTLIYCDPPYSFNKGKLGDNRGWKGLESLQELLNLLLENNVSFAISEHYNKKIVDFVKSYSFLNIHLVSKNIGQNKNINNEFNKNKKSLEVLITNYNPDFKNCLFGLEF